MEWGRDSSTSLRYVWFETGLQVGEEGWFETSPYVEGIGRWECGEDGSPHPRGHGRGLNVEWGRDSSTSLRYAQNDIWVEGGGRSWIPAFAGMTVGIGVFRWIKAGSQRVLEAENVGGMGCTPIQTFPHQGGRVYDGRIVGMREEDGFLSSQEQEWWVRFCARCG